MRRKTPVSAILSPICLLSYLLLVSCSTSSDKKGAEEENIIPKALIGEWVELTGTDSGYVALLPCNRGIATLNLSHEEEEFMLSTGSGADYFSVKQVARNQQTLEIALGNEALLEGEELIISLEIQSEEIITYEGVTFGKASKFPTTRVNCEEALNNNENNSQVPDDFIGSWIVLSESDSGQFIFVPCDVEPQSVMLGQNDLTIGYGHDAIRFTIDEVSLHGDSLSFQITNVDLPDEGKSSIVLKKLSSTSLVFDDEVYGLSTAYEHHDQPCSECFDDCG